MLQRSLDRARARRSDEGFTLIELLIVIVILGILAAIVIFAATGITDTAHKNSCKSDIQSTNVAIEAYYAQNSSYPTTMADLNSYFHNATPPTDVELISSGKDAASNATGNCQGVTAGTTP